MNPADSPVPGAPAPTPADSPLRTSAHALQRTTSEVLRILNEGGPRTFEAQAALYQQIGQREADLQAQIVAADHVVRRARALVETVWPEWFNEREAAGRLAQDAASATPLGPLGNALRQLANALKALDNPQG